MVAYAALVSLMHIIDQLEHHPPPTISLDKIQAVSLTENVTFLQEFLEGHSHVIDYRREAESLESRIADAAHAAEDIIESHIVDQILSGSTSHGEKISSDDLYEGLQKVIRDMDEIKKEVVEIKEKTKVEDQLRRNPTPAGSVASSSTVQNITVVGLDDVCLEIMDELTGGQLDRQLVSIVGMGGIGKTTLAQNIYKNQVVVQHFHCLAWGTVSQKYSTIEILLQILLCLKGKRSRENLSEMDEDELGEVLYKSLSGRSYLIILDDIWNIEAWDKIKFFFPDNKNGSRIMLTTRLSNLALQLSDSHVHNMNFLDEDESWYLFCKKVFGEEDCPFELKEIGKKIVKNCKGLPLSITVIGGLLAKSEQTREYWEHIADNLNSIVILEDNERCLQILYMSYNSLPVYLKPCFLYMGVFPEDDEIPVWMVIMLWVGEGFLKPVCGKSLEEAGQDYLKELIDRNLILVQKCKYTGKMKTCIIHDLLRDLCLREAQKQKFLYVRREQSLNIPRGINIERRILFHKSTPDEEVLHALESASLVRSLIIMEKDMQTSLPFSLRLLRILLLDCCPEAIFQKVNLRLIFSGLADQSEIPSSISLFWNLKTLFLEVDSGFIMAPSEIWKMPQLRHVLVDGLCLPDPPSDDMNGRYDTILENLQTLAIVNSFMCSEEVVKRIPNIKKLAIQYLEDEEGLRDNDYCLNNLARLHKLESLRVACDWDPEDMGNHLEQSLTFPHSLKELTLIGSCFQLEDMLEKIGSLPLLEMLKLINWSFRSGEWETVEGQFRSLKFLLIEGSSLEHWTTESSHFPRLERLVLDGVEELKEIPTEIGEISTLQLIHLENCSDSAANSAKRILEEQAELGNVGLQVSFKGLYEDDFYSWLDELCLL